MWGHGCPKRFELGEVKVDITIQSNKYRLNSYKIIIPIMIFKHYSNWNLNFLITWNILFLKMTMWYYFIFMISVMVAIFHFISMTSIQSFRTDVRCKAELLTYTRNRQTPSDDNSWYHIFFAIWKHSNVHLTSETRIAFSDHVC